MKEQREEKPVISHGVPHGELMLESFVVVCNGLHTASELVTLGEYDQSHVDRADRLFRIKRHTPVSRMIELVKFDHGVSREEVFFEFERIGLERPTWEDALYFGIQHPEESSKHPIVFLHEPVLDSKNELKILVLRMLHGERRLDLLSWYRHEEWGRTYVFAGIRSK